MPTPPAYLHAHATTFTADPRQAAIDWFREAKYGLFLHYGLYSLLGRHEWVQLHEKLYVHQVEALAQQFTAERFDAEAICQLALDAGMKYVNLTTRHHDGFCLWHTQQTDFHSVAAPRCGRDLVAELAAACDRHRLGLCLYYSHGRDWRHPHAPNNAQFGGSARPAYDPPEHTYCTGPKHDLNRYVDFMTAQVTELLINYGPMAAIWLDGIMVPLTPKDAQGNIRQDYDPSRDGDPFRCQALYDLVHQLQPQCLVSYKQGYLGTEDFFAPEHKAYNRFGEAAASRPTEVCTTMCDRPIRSWGYLEAGVGQHKTADEVWETLRQARSSGSNLLLNTGPLPDGSLDAEDAATLRAVGQRLQREGFPGE